MELLTDVTDEFKNGLTEGFVLRCKNDVYTVNEILIEKSIDFDNYRE